MSLFENANAKAVLIAGDNPEWVIPPTTTGLPSASNAGVPLGDALKTHVRVDTRLDLSTRTAFAIPGAVVDLATTYTVKIGVTSVNTTPSAAVLDTLVTEMAADINADVVANLVVQAVPVDDDGANTPGSNTRVKITGLTDADYTFDATVAGGTGTITGTADALSVDVTGFGFARNFQATSAPQGWVQLPSLTDTVGPGGLLVTVDTAALSQLFMRQENVAPVVGDGGSITATTAVRVGRSVLP